MAVQLHPSTRMGEVKLKVSNLQRSMKFYQEVIGLKVLTHNESIAQLTVDGTHHLLILEELPNAVTMRERTTTGLYHFAYSCQVVSSLDCH